MNEIEINANALYVEEFLKTLLENGYTFTITPFIIGGELKMIIIKNICHLWRT